MIQDKSKVSSSSATSGEHIREKNNTVSTGDVENRFKHFANIAVDLFWETDAELRFTYLSDGYEAATGIAPELVIGTSRKDLIRDMVDEKTCEEHFRLLDQHLPYDNLIYQWKGHDGRLITIKSRGQPYFDEQKVFCGYRGVASDITESCKAQLALKASEERFQAFAEIAADLFWETDDKLRFTYLSDRYKEITGVSPEKVLGMERKELVLEMLNPKQREQHRKDLEEKLPYDDLEYEWCVPGGHRLILRSSARPFYDDQGKFRGYRGVARDITATYQAQKMIYHATHDYLTGLVNRRAFQERLEKAVISAQDRPTTHVLCYLDLDQFKVVNDTTGHESGDNLLREISDLIKRHIRQRDTLARLGGDEFGLLMDNCTTEQGKKVAEKLVAAIDAYQFKWKGRSFKVGVSIGLVSIDSSASSAQQLLSQADVACYTAKDMGRNCAYTYQPESDGLDRRHSEIIRAAELKDALSDDRFNLVAQQIVPLRPQHSSCKQYEILLRMQGADKNELSPDEFIPAAERYGLMPMIDQYVFDQALEVLGTALKSNKITRININVSGKSMVDNTLFEYAAQAVRNKKIPPESICFEITETSLINNLSSVAELIDAMKAEGFQFALDDFGSGFSSFTYMKQLPVNYLKIDGTFVHNIATDNKNRAIVKAITEMGHSMGMQTIAEYAESQAVVDTLTELGVDWAQGFALGRVVPVTEII